MAKKTDFAKVYAEMVVAAKEAVKACTPTPMMVGQAKGIFSNEIDRSKPVYIVNDGACGFAWVCLKGNTSFGKWAKANEIARDAYPSGLKINAYKMAPEINQSIQKAEVAVAAAAKVLKDYGVECYTDSRLD